MKLLLLVCLFICYIPVVNGQAFNEYAYIDHKVLRMPGEITYSTASISNWVQSNFNSERERLRAIYAWVTTNIQYDKDSMYYINWSMFNDEKIAATLRRRKGVCENYASLFTDLAIKNGFQSFAISGYTRLSGSVNRSGHSWCAVNLGQQWFLCDPTWDAGAGGNTKYYLISPGEFIESHMPFDPLWQLLEYPITEQEFSKGGFQSKKNKTYFNFSDSVKNFLQLDSLKQLEASTLRIRQAGIENERMKNWHSYNQMKIAIIYGEKDMDLYNSAVEDLNNANGVFNDFVKYRNNRFIPSKPDSEIREMLSPINGLLVSAQKNLDEIGKSVENFQYDTGIIRERIASLGRRANEQQFFLNRYLSTNVADRDKLFFK